MRRFKLAALLTGLALAGATEAHAASVTVTETGSTLLYPLFRIWAPQYGKTVTNFHLITNGTGSRAGIDAAMAGTAAIGASDAYMTDAQMAQNPNIIDVPLAISAQTVNYNIPGLNGTSLRFDGPTLASIYAGSIRSWDAEAIVALNPGVKLPHHDIVPIRRSDGSGDTFIFSQFLSFSTPAWENGPGAGTAIDWPAVPNGITARGNAGMVQATRLNPYSISYIGISSFREIAAAGLGTARLKNESGSFVLPTPKTIAAAASVLGPRTPTDERLSLVFAPGADSYPLVNYEYAIVSTKQSDPATAAAVRGFLLWTIATCQGNAPSDLDAVHFIALPDYIRALSDAQLVKIR